MRRGWLVFLVPALAGGLQPESVGPGNALLDSVLLACLPDSAAATDFGGEQHLVYVDSVGVWYRHCRDGVGKTPAIRIGSGRVSNPVVLVASEQVGLAREWVITALWRDVAADRISVVCSRRRLRLPHWKWTAVRDVTPARLR